MGVHAGPNLGENVIGLTTSKEVAIVVQQRRQTDHLDFSTFDFNFSLLFSLLGRALD